MKTMESSRYATSIREWARKLDLLNHDPRSMTDSSFGARGYCNWTMESQEYVFDKLENPCVPSLTQYSSKRTSVPFAKHQIPGEAEERVRGFLRETMPHLAERPFSFARICWCADTPNRAFLISKHPDYPSLGMLWRYI